MSHPKECDTTIVGLRILKKSDVRPGTPPRAACAEIVPDKPQAIRVTFLEDFTLEHSLHGLRITLIESAGIF